MNKSTVGTATRSLRKLWVQSRLQFFEDQETKRPAERDQWGFVCSLSQPQFSELRLDFHPAFSPTHDDIESISKSSSQLRRIEFNMDNRRNGEIAPPETDGSVFYDAEWLYLRSSRASKMVTWDVSICIC
jgi:hypothetical protein